MENIGKIIKLYREKVGMSQCELAKDICSSKYVFLIEKGERTPSTFLLRKFSSRLNVNLFDLYQYIDCIDPVNVYETINMFEKYKSNSDFENLKNLTNLKKTEPDFQRNPWCCEIIINECTCKIIKESAIHETISELTYVLNNFHHYSYMEFQKAKIHSLLALCYQKTNNTINWHISNKAAYDLLQNRENIMPYIHHTQFHQLVVGITINRLFLLLQMKDYENLAFQAEDLLNYQRANGIYERTHFSFFFLFVAYYYLQNSELALQNYKNAMYITLLDDKTEDVKQFRKIDIFNIMTERFANHSFVLDYYKKYGKNERNSQE